MPTQLFSVVKFDFKMLPILQEILSESSIFESIL